MLLFDDKRKKPTVDLCFPNLVERFLCQFLMQVEHKRGPHLQLAWHVCGFLEGHADVSGVHHTPIPN